jgi:hypothetical protein
MATPKKGSEFNGKWDESGLSVPAHPRPLTTQRYRTRAENLSGDPTGNTPADPTKSWWHGGDKVEGDARVRAEVARQELDEAIVELWYG